MLFGTNTKLDTTSCKVVVIPVRAVKKIFSTDFRKKKPNIKIHENPSSGPRVVSRWRTDGRTDLTKLRVAYRNFSNAPKNRPGRCDTSDVATHPKFSQGWSWRSVGLVPKFSIRAESYTTFKTTHPSPRTVGTHTTHYTTSRPAMPCSDFHRSALKTKSSGLWRRFVVVGWIYWLVEELLACQQGLCLVQLVSQSVSHSVSQPVSKSASQLFSQSVSRPVSQSVSQSVSQ